MTQPDKARREFTPESPLDRKELDLSGIYALIAKLKQKKPEVFRHLVGIVRAILKE